MDIVDQLPRHLTKRYETRDLEAINTLVLHHTGTGPDVTPEEIALYHVHPHGNPPEEWPGIGYHYVMTADGTLYQTQRLETMSYHVASRNRTSVGLCVVGDFTKGEPMEAQQAALWLAIDHIILAWNHDDGRSIHLMSHSQYALSQYPTGCPGRLMEWLQ